MRNPLCSLGIVVLLGVCRLASAADFVVLTNSDSGPGSLRDAITAANAAPGPDRIVFNIPGAGVQTISVLSPFPDMTDELVIDGYTQPGAKPNSLQTGDDAVILISLDGFLAHSNGLTIKASNCTIRGLSMTGFLINPGPPSLLGGVAITVQSGSGNKIEGCFLGIYPDGTGGRPNGRGIDVRAAGTSIGGKSPTTRNIISGNSQVGLLVVSDGTAVAGNYIGTDASGTRARGNPTGIQIGGPHTTTVIGGTTSDAGNLVSGNFIGIGVGVSSDNIFSATASGVVVQGNLIGTTANGVSGLGNLQGVVVDGSHNLIGGLTPGASNIIAFNSSGGVTIRGGSSNSILSNSIYSTNRIGIDLDQTGLPLPNDIGDGDGANRANNYQNFPTIDSVVIANNSAAIQGSLNSTPNTQFTIQFFAESQSLTDSKQTYLGSTGTTTNGNGDASFSAQFTVPSPDVRINATATSASGDTSEFFLNAGHFRNISTRGRVETGQNVMIAGFILTNDAPVVVRAIAPSLTSPSVPNPLPDPVLEIYGSNGFSAQNDNWGDESFNGAGVQGYGLAPRHPAEAALMRILSAGVYTVVVHGKGNAAGTALVEVYDVSDVGPRTQGGNLANISTRGFVQTGDNILIGGIVIGRGDLPPRVVVRGIGPSLTQNGIVNPLPDPVVELRDNNGILLFANDNWKDNQQADLEANGLAPRNDAESAILTRLGPGNYTAVLRGKNGSTGIGLVELYRIP